MFRFYYNNLKSKYNEKIKLLATDRDSLIMYIETHDVYEDIKNNIKNYDTYGFTIDWMPQKMIKFQDYLKTNRICWFSIKNVCI